MIAWRSDTAAKVIFANYCFDVRLKSLAFFIFFYFLLKLKLSFVTEGSRLVQSVSANKFKFFTEKLNVFYEHLPRALGPQNFFVITIWNWRLIKICRWYKKQPKMENNFVFHGKKWICYRAHAIHWRQTQRRKQQHLNGHYALAYGKFRFYLLLQGIHFRKNCGLIFKRPRAWQGLSAASSKYCESTVALKRRLGILQPASHWKLLFASWAWKHL